MLPWNPGQTSPMTSDQFQNFFNAPEPFLDPKNGYGERQVPWFEANILPDFLSLKLEGPLLDVGCGCGYFTRRYAEHYASVMGLDFSKDRLGKAMSYNNLPHVLYILGDLTNEKLNVPFAPKAIVTSAVIQHIPPDKQKTAFANLHRLSTPGATMVMYDSIEGVWDPFYMPPRESWLRTELLDLWTVRDCKYHCSAPGGERIFRVVLDRVDH